MPNQASENFFPGNTDLGESYEQKGRFASYWHQIDEITRLDPRSCLEIGVGTRFVATYLRLRRPQMQLSTLDINPELQPDLVGSVLDIPCEDQAFDVSSCCQVLEHLPFDDFLPALRELKRVTRSKLVLSLPDLRRRYPLLVKIPKLPEVRVLLELPQLFPQKWEFNGEHHWNIGVRDYPLERILEAFDVVGLRLEKTYCVFEFPWHRFFVLGK
ncbi:MAG: class I SAM-dependent methyltransferase [Aquabacterium sp.]|nr:MAG: class I SAM-dependent methyltransferase [Aquabacterium sp.]